MKIHRILRSELINLRAVKNYAVAVVSVFVALIINLLLSRWIEPRTTPLFLAAVAVAAWRGGKYPSLLATALAVLAIDFFFDPPFYVLDFGLESIVNAVVFVAVALLISWIDDERKGAARERDASLQNERAARLAAEEASREKDEFLAMVTHDLRSPLNAILGWTQMLKKETLGGEQKRHALTVIERSARTQGQLIEDLLDVSRIKTGKFRVTTEPVDFRPVIEEAIESVASSVAAKRIHLHCEFGDGVGLINGDAGRLQQVVWNLLSNAVKFTPEEGQIEVCLTRCGRSARLTVYNVGAGIKPEFLPFIFDSYRQAEDDTRALHKGLGLGLAIVRHLVEAHGGTVRAASPGVGLGATFTVELPLLTEVSGRKEILSANGSRLEKIGKPAFQSNP